jgi:hypothetical protein
LHGLNPKSITKKVLFGSADDAGEWHGKKINFSNKKLAFFTKKKLVKKLLIDLFKKMVLLQKYLENAMKINLTI